jgi:hypothetical protein
VKREKRRTGSILKAIFVSVLGILHLQVLTVADGDQIVRGISATLYIRGNRIPVSISRTSTSRYLS